LHSAGCPWDEDTCRYAAKNGHATILQWALDHGCPEPINDRDYDDNKNNWLGM
jgi:hypothetical protein